MRPCVTWDALRSWTIAPVPLTGGESDTAVMCPTTRPGFRLTSREGGKVRQVGCGRATQRNNSKAANLRSISGLSLAVRFPPSAPSAFNILQYLKLFDFFPS